MYTSKDFELEVKIFPELTSIANKEPSMFLFDDYDYKVRVLYALELARKDPRDRVGELLYADPELLILYLYDKQKQTFDFRLFEWHPIEQERGQCSIQIPLSYVEVIKVPHYQKYVKERIYKLQKPLEIKKIEESLIKMSFRWKIPAQDLCLIVNQHKPTHAISAGQLN